MRVLKVGNEVRLRLETANELRAVGEFVTDHLDRDLAFDCWL